MKISDLIAQAPDAPGLDRILDSQIPLPENSMLADMAIVGDPPDTYECMERKSFHGANFKNFNRLCAAIGTPKYKLYLTNVIKAKLLRSEYKKVYTPKGFRCPQWGELQKRLIDELAAFPGKVIVCMGDFALRMLLDDPKITSISKYRGSIYKAEQFPHLAEALKGKFIAITYAPYDFSPRMKPTNFYVAMNDLQKFAALNTKPELLDLKPTLHVAPKFQEVIDFLHKVKTGCGITSVDIEATPKFVTCFALTYNDMEAMSIPLMDNKGSYWTVSEEVMIWKLFAEILESTDIGKIFQNGMFDIMFLLRTMNIKTRHFVFDTMIAQHICWTDLPKGLDFLVSIYTYFPSYKDENKKSHLQAVKDWPAYWLYNCKDALYTLHVANKLEDELNKFDAWKDFTYMMNLHAPLMEMEFNGILVATEKVRKQKARLEHKLRALQHGLNKLAGKELNHNSPKQMVAYMYGTCMIKPYINRKSGNATCDAVALSRIAKKKVPGSSEARLIMKMRKYHKLVSTYFNVTTDADSRLRCAHKICGTVSGRISTEKTFFGTGANLQNQPYVFKEYLIADEDYYLIEGDLAKAEAHCVAFLSQDANMIEAFESGIDIHIFNACKIFNLTTEEFHAMSKAEQKKKRDMGKRIVHASNYNMGPQTFSDNLAKDEIYMSMGECRTLLKAYRARFPGLTRWQREIDAQVTNTRMLYNMFGRPKRFLGMLDAATFRNAYSYIPQSTVAELLNRGMINAYHDPFFEQYDMSALATVHDSTMWRIHKYHLPDLPKIFDRITQHMTHEFIHKGRAFTIGFDLCIGTAWAGNKIELADSNIETIMGAVKELDEKRTR